MGVDYDVFLNHCGRDTKAGFVAHLDEALKGVGLNPFLDKISLRTGDEAPRAINEALEAAKIHVAVVSKGYAESIYCLNELVIIMRSGKPVIPVFYDVDPGQLRGVDNGPFASALEEHRSSKTADQVEEWRDALWKLGHTVGLCFRSSDYEGDEAALKRKVVDAVLTHLKLPAQGEKEHVKTFINGLERNKLEISSVMCLLCLVGLGWYGFFKGLLWILNLGSISVLITVTIVVCFFLGRFIISPVYVQIQQEGIHVDVQCPPTMIRSSISAIQKNFA